MRCYAILLCFRNCIGVPVLHGKPHELQQSTVEYREVVLVVQQHLS